jgi:23S rRNA (uracil747-C5)-methyltransferase
MHCPHFIAERCRSCTRIELTQQQQIAAHQADAQALLARWPQVLWLEPVLSAEHGFRNKAKMVVSGSADAPLLGILGADGRAVDLGDCALYPAGLQACFDPLRLFIARAQLHPYDVLSRRGELKFVLLTQDADSGGLLLRLVLRSREALDRVRGELPWLQTQLPLLRVVSVNLQPVHQAVLEGPTEIILTEQTELAVLLNDVSLRLRPQSFFQTNTAVASALYAQVRRWVAQCNPRELLDLYCGVGGFALHCAAPGRRVRGLELSAEAVASAQGAAAAAGWSELSFECADATGLSDAQLSTELLIVNPPRRGIGAVLAQQINQSTVQTLIYSSCNARSLAADLLGLDQFQLVRAQVYQMFPHTDHYELLTLLQRRGVRTASHPHP